MSSKPAAAQNPQAIVGVFTQKPSDLDGCRKYIREKSGAPVQLEIGELLCVMQFGNSAFTPTQDSGELSRCIMNDFGDIVEEINRNRLIAKCNLKIKDKNLGYIIIEEYSDSKRIEKILENERRGRSRNYENPFPITSSDQPDGQVTLDINGSPKTCMKIGMMLECD